LSSEGIEGPILKDDKQQKDTILAHLYWLLALSVLQSKGAELAGAAASVCGSNSGRCGWQRSASCGGNTTM
jgi:hypothetical protein